MEDIHLKNRTFTNIIAIIVTKDSFLEVQISLWKLNNYDIL